MHGHRRHSQAPPLGPRPPVGGARSELGVALAEDRLDEPGPLRLGEGSPELVGELALLPGPETGIFGVQVPCAPIQKPHTEPIYIGKR